MKRLELMGQRFERLLVLGFSHADSGGNSKWVCLCDCGTEKVITVHSLTSGATRSCGCLQRETISKIRFIHGMSKGLRRHPLYSSWLTMKSRCRNQKVDSWKDYGGRGISVCDRWDSFENFLADMGERPPGTSIDRVDNDGNYELQNCRWATPTEQAQNRGPRRSAA